MLSTTSNKKVVAVIPIYNEGPVVREVINSLLPMVTTVIAVDDGSATPAINLLQGLPITLLRHRVNLGQGAALQTGLYYALQLQPDVVITFDADGQHSVEDVTTIIQPILSNQSDVVLGSRFLSNSQSNVPLARKGTLQIARLINFFLSGVLLSDAHNGLRALNRVALEKINLTENRMAHASEFLFEIKKHQLRYKEVPVQIHYTDYSREKGQSGSDSIKVLFDLVLHKLFK